MTYLSLAGRYSVLMPNTARGARVVCAVETWAGKTSFGSGESMARGAGDGLSLGGSGRKIGLLSRSFW